MFQFQINDFNNVFMIIFFVKIMFFYIPTKIFHPFNRNNDAKAAHNVHLKGEEEFRMTTISFPG
jgi:hypothetical protein